MHGAFEQSTKIRKLDSTFFLKKKGKKRRIIMFAVGILMATPVESKNLLELREREYGKERVVNK